MLTERVISILCKDHSGVVNRITALFFARNLNIHKLTVCETEDPEVREIFIELPYEEENTRYIVSLLSKIIDIIQVEDITDQIKFEQQHCMIRMKTDLDTFKAKCGDLNVPFLAARGEWVYIALIDSVKDITYTIERVQEHFEVIYVRSGRLFLQ